MACSFVIICYEQTQAHLSCNVLFDLFFIRISTYQIASHDIEEQKFRAGYSLVCIFCCVV